MDIKKIEKLINEFDNNFNTREKERIKNLPIIMSIFEQFSYDIYRGNNYYKKLEETAEKIMKQLNLSKEEKRLLEKWIEYEISIMNEFVEIAFIYGICIKEELEKETNNEWPMALI